jgi:hypothetical protein
MNIEGAERLAVRGIDDVVHQIDRMVISCHDFLADRVGDPSLATKMDVSASLGRLGLTFQSRPAERGRPWVSDYLYVSASKRDVDRHS